MKVDNKKVVQYALQALGERCHCYVLDRYFTRMAPDSRDDSFYFKPLQKAPEDPNPAWFFPKFVLGKNAFSTMVKTMFAEAGFKGKSNHSLRVAGATRLFSGGVPERIIQERAGHRSVEALRLYERPSEDQLRTACAVISGKENASTSPPETTDAVESKKRSDLSVIQGASGLPSMAMATVKNCTFNFIMNDRK